MSRDDELKRKIAEAKKGGAPKYHQKNTEQHKLFARTRLERLLDSASFIEDGLLANSGDPELPRLIHLQSSRKTVLYNGAIECRLYEYRMVAGGNRPGKPQPPARAAH